MQVTMILRSRNGPRPLNDGKTLTPLGDDGAGGDDDDGPVELALEVRDDLVADLTESGEAAEGNAHEQSLAHRTIGLLVFNQISAVDEDLGQACLQTGVVHL